MCTVSGMDTAARPDAPADDLLTETLRLWGELAEVEGERTEAKGKLAEAEADLAKSKEENAALKRELEAQERSSKRQAAPFAKGEKKTNPKKPGRKRVQGTFKHRPAPTQDEITDTVDVPLSSDRCPFCNSANLSAVRIEDACLAPTFPRCRNPL